MAQTLTYLVLNDTQVHVDPLSYSVEYHDVVTDDSGVTEAGTTIRHTSRRAVPTISASFTVDETHLALLAGFYKNSASLTVNFYDAGTLSDDWEMYISEFSFDVIADDGSNVFFKVNLKMEDYKDVSDL